MLPQDLPLAFLVSCVCPRTIPKSLSPKIVYEIHKTLRTKNDRNPLRVTIVECVCRNAIVVISGSRRIEGPGLGFDFCGWLGLPILRIVQFTSIPVLKWFWRQSACYPHRDSTFVAVLVPSQDKPQSNMRAIRTWEIGWVVGRGIVPPVEYHSASLHHQVSYSRFH